MIKNDKGQYYAVKCETLEENNKVFSLCGYNTIRNYYEGGGKENQHTLVVGVCQNRLRKLDIKYEN